MLRSEVESASENRHFWPHTYMLFELSFNMLERPGAANSKRHPPAKEQVKPDEEEAMVRALVRTELI